MERTKRLSFLLNVFLPLALAVVTLFSSGVVLLEGRRPHDTPFNKADWYDAYPDSRIDWSTAPFSGKLGFNLFFGCIFLLYAPTFCYVILGLIFFDTPWRVVDLPAKFVKPWWYWVTYGLFILAFVSLALSKSYVRSNGTPLRKKPRPRSTVQVQWNCRPVAVSGYCKAVPSSRVSQTEFSARRKRSPQT